MRTMKLNILQWVSVFLLICTDGIMGITESEAIEKLKMIRQILDSPTKEAHLPQQPSIPVSIPVNAPSMPSHPSRAKIGSRRKRPTTKRFSSIPSNKTVTNEPSDSMTSSNLSNAPAPLVSMPTFAPMEQPMKVPPSVDRLAAEAQAAFQKRQRRVQSRNLQGGALPVNQNPTLVKEQPLTAPNIAHLPTYNPKESLPIRTWVGEGEPGAYTDSMYMGLTVPQQLEYAQRLADISRQKREARAPQN